MRKNRWAWVVVVLAGCGNVGGGISNPLPPSTHQPIDSGITVVPRRDAGRDVSLSDSASLRPIDGGGPVAEVTVLILTPVEPSILKAASSPEVRAKITTTQPADAGAIGDQVETVTYTFVRVGDKNSKPLVKGPLFGPAANSEFATRTDLSTLETGDYILEVVALTQHGGVGSSAINVRVDAGPTLRIVSPKSGGFYKGSVAVQVQVDSTPFVPTLEPIEATVGGYPVPLVFSPALGMYEGLIQFETYVPPLVDEQKLTVAAKNSLGTRREAEVKFVVDVRGPVFSESRPLPGEVVGGVMRVRTKVEDPAGVLGPSVVAVITDQLLNVNFTLELKPEEGAPGYYSALFDTAKFPRCRPAPNNDLCVVLPNLSFRASDILGNDSFMAYDFAVDNIAPIFDLDPPADMRLKKFEKKLRMDVCSWALDPLGNWSRPGDMPNQNCMVPQIFDMRANIEDQSNLGYDLKVGPISGIDPATTSMYVLDDTTQPLVVDVDGDGYCDEINPLLIPTAAPLTKSNQVLTVRLAAVPPNGSGDFTPDPSLENNANPDCNPGIDPEAPPRLCAVQTIPIAMGYPTALDPQAAVWTIEPLTEKEPFCLGGQFDTFANQISEKSWACFAAAGADRNGNKGVSEPLRVWVVYKREDYETAAAESGIRIVDESGPTCPAPPEVAGPAPNCTGTYNPVTKQVSNVPCSPRVFTRGRFRFQQEAAEAGGAT